jgi:hypothetical protein
MADNLLEIIADVERRHPVDTSYPQRPGWKARDTARAAADDAAPKAPRLRQLCLSELAKSNGLTADECAARLGIDKLSIRPRFSELSATGEIVDSGERRLNASGKRAVVWRLPAVETRLAA